MSAQRHGLGLASGGLIGALGGLVGFGGAEFRLPLLKGMFRLATLEAVIFNKAMSLLVVATALLARSGSIPWAEVGGHGAIILNLLAGSLLGAWFAAGRAIHLPEKVLNTTIGHLEKPTPSSERYNHSSQFLPQPAHESPKRHQDRPLCR